MSKNQMPCHKETRQLIRLAKKQGWSAELTKGGHVRLTPPNGDYIVMPSPSDWRGIRNAKARLRRAGLVV